MTSCGRMCGRGWWECIGCRTSRTSSAAAPPTASAWRSARASWACCAVRVPSGGSRRRPVPRSAMRANRYAVVSASTPTRMHSRPCCLSMPARASSASSAAGRAMHCGSSTPMRRHAAISLAWSTGRVAPTGRCRHASSRTRRARRCRSSTSPA
ncbi:hypothetical protein G6F22_020040 [Rhizopus arrhizus]|nr:hypothetical protein G6F22_020040 [Rhizopus arrhizus]